MPVAPFSRAVVLASWIATGSACRPAPAFDKQPEIDLAAAPGPAAAAFNREAELAEGWIARIRPRWSAGRDGFFTAADGVQLHFHVVQAASERGAVVVLPGRTEPVLKYAELADDLARLGWTTWLLDLRGQGESARLTDNPQKGHVRAFSDYADDLDQFVREIVRPANGERPFLLAHSTGATIALAHADEHPDVFEGMALSTPMLDIDTGSFPPIVAATLAVASCSSGAGAGYVVGDGDFEDETDFERNTVTRSRARWEWKVQLLHDNPPLQIGGSTWQWVCESFQASARLQGLGRFNATPTLFFQAGEDSIVLPAGQERYCRDAPRCQLTRFETALHEVFQERDEIRNAALSQSLRFFEAVQAR